MAKPDPNWKKYEHRLLVAFIINFALFWVIAVGIGGDAVNGRIENGLYLLSSHGTDTPVSPWLWHYSLTHTRLVITSFIIVFIYGLIKNLITKKAA